MPVADQARTTFRFVEEARGATSHRELDFAFGRLIGEWGFDTWQAVRISTSPHILRDPFGQQFGTGPVLWSAHYKKHGFIESDPIVRQVFARPDEAFTWRSILETQPIDRAGQRVMSEAADFGIRSGLTIPVVFFDGTVYATSMSSEASLSIHDETLDACNIAAQTYVARSRRLLKSPLRTQERQLNETQVRVITLLCAGHTQPEVAALMGLSTSGIEYHIADAKKRMGAKTLAQLVARAIDSREVTPLHEE